MVHLSWAWQWNEKIIQQGLSVPKQYKYRDKYRRKSWDEFYVFSLGLEAWLWILHPEILRSLASQWQ